VFQAIRDEIVHRLAPLTNHGVEEICHERPFTQLGIGSLVVTELRIWLQQTFQIEVTSSEIMSAGRINSLVNLTLKRLKRSCQERMMGWIARKAFKSMGMRWKQQKGSARLFVTRTVVLQSCIYLVNVIRSTFPQSNL
jgi:acyl carrier protein